MSRSEKLKALLVVEFVLVLIALVMPVTPDKTGKPFVLPPDLRTYFEEVLVALALGHAVILVIAAIVWILVRLQKGRSRHT